MDKRGRKVLSSLSFVMILLLVGSILFVSSQVSDSQSNDSSTNLTQEEKQVVNDKVEESLGSDVSPETVAFVETFVKQRGITPEEINNVSQVDFASLPEEVEVDNVNDANLAIFEVNFNDTEKNDEEKKVFVVTYSAEKIETTKDLIIHPDSRSFLHFGLVDEIAGTAFLKTASGVPGSLDQGYVMMRQGSITGISTNLEVTKSSEGIIDVIIYKNGEAISFGNTIQIESDSSGKVEKDFDIQSKGVVSFEPGDTISVKVASSNSGISYKGIISMVEITTVD